MLYFPPAKINLGLQILRRRDDGFHDLELSFFAVPELCDVLEIVPAAAQADELKVQDAFIRTGLEISAEPISPGEDLVEKARDLLRERSVQKGRCLPPCRIHLHKNIPAGSGLGGGSSDAAFTLTGLNRLFHLGFEQEELENMAASLGSDCAFFVRAGTAPDGVPLPCIGKGKGEFLSPLQTAHRLNYHILLCVPENIRISTAEAYRDCLPQQGRPPLGSLLQNDACNWRETIANDFERSLFPKYPLLKEIKERLYDSGADYASLSGSGSAVFGLYSREDRMKEAALQIAAAVKGTTFAGHIAIP